MRSLLAVGFCARLSSAALSAALPAARPAADPEFAPFDLFGKNLVPPATREEARIEQEKL